MTRGELVVVAVLTVIILVEFGLAAWLDRRMVDAAGRQGMGRPSGRAGRHGTQG